MTSRPSDPGTVTDLLRLSQAGDLGARDQLFVRVDTELREVARSMLRARGLGPGAIRGTELVNMACERLLGRDQLRAEDRAHFFYLMGRAMRDALADEARKALSRKRGGDRTHEPMFEIPDPVGMRTVSLVDLTGALGALRSVDPGSADALEHHYLAGRSLRETSELMGVSLFTVRQHVTYGSAWLRTRLESSG